MNKSCLECGEQLVAESPQGVCPMCVVKHQIKSDLRRRVANGSSVSVPSPDQATITAIGTRVPAQPLPVDTRRFGDYELLGEIAAGGMGMIYKARQTNLDRLVALKMILTGRLATQSQVLRFRAEAEAAANLDHPNIVPIYEVGELEGNHYFSMKLVEGTSLAQQITQFQNNFAGIARLLVTVARAVHYAHQRGIIHRDLKPSNIMIDLEGRPHVTDFGLAKRFTADKGLTQSGTLMGTPAYMAPEQAATDKVPTTAVDVYSLGVILYELLTGRPPFLAETPMEIMRQLCQEEPVRPRSLNPKVDRDLETICLKCLEKEPQRRYESAEALAADLERWLNHWPILARRTGVLDRVVKWCWRHPAIAVLSGLLVLGAVVASLLLEGKSQLAIRKGRELEQLGYLNNIASAERELQVGETFVAGQLLSECRPEFRHWEWAYLNLKGSSREAVRTLVGHGDRVLGVAFSPNSRQIVSVSADETARLWDVASGSLVLTLPPQGDYLQSVAFSPEGGQFVIGGHDGSVSLWDARDGHLIRRLAGHSDVVRHVAFSPDGQRLASAGEDQSVKIWEVNSGQLLLELRGLNGLVFCVNFSPDGKQLATAGYDQSVRIWDTTSGRDVRQLSGHTAAVRSVAFSPDGRWLASGGIDTTIRVWDLKGHGEPLVLRRHGGYVYSLAFSPDSKRLVSASLDKTVKLWDPVTGNEVLTLRGHDDEVYSVAFSPDGRSIVSGSRDQKVKVWQSALSADPGVGSGTH